MHIFVERDENKQARVAQNWHVTVLEMFMSIAVYREPKLDPIYHLMPEDQLTRVLGQDMVDIDAEFLGFTEIYMSLADIIPKHWTVIDLGCAYAPQAILFKDHLSYVGVDMGPRERFQAPNTTHFCMEIERFIQERIADYDLDETFAICSYVPNWLANNRDLVRAAFPNVFTYYPHGTMKRFAPTP